MPAEGRGGPGLGARLASVALVAGLGALDLATKSWAFDALQDLPGRTRPVMPPVLSLTLSENPGIILGLGASIKPVFTVIAFGMLAGLLVVLWRRRLPTAWRLALAGIAAGALGNGVDRFRLGHVRDFIDVHYHGFANPMFNFTYPTFNVADMCICVGAGILAVGLWRAPEEKPAS